MSEMSPKDYEAKRLARKRKTEADIKRASSYFTSRILLYGSLSIFTLHVAWMSLKNAMTPSVEPPAAPQSIKRVEEAAIEPTDREKSGDKKREEHLEMLMLDSWGSCLRKYDQFGDNPEARETCKKIALQEAENRYIRGE